MVPVLRGRLLPLALAALGCTAPADDDDTTAADDDLPPIEALEIDELPDNVLGCIVRWTTSAPATTELTAVDPSGEAYRWSDPSVVTDHVVEVLGLRAETAYSLQGVSADADGTMTWRGEGELETGSLPFPMPSLTLTAHDPALAQPGWTLTSFLVESDLEHRAAVMLDEEGQVRWYQTFASAGAMAAVEVSATGENEQVLVGPLPEEGQRPFEVTLTGDRVWVGPSQPALGVSGYMHHTLRKLPDGDYVALFFDWVDGTQIDVIERFGPDGEAVWRWDSEALVAETGSSLWTNAVQLDGEAVYLNSRMHSLLYRIDRDTLDVVWALGEGGDFALAGDHGDPWFAGAHATTRLADGNVLAYDNGTGVRDYSRVIEYELDEGARTAQVVWEYPGAQVEDAWYTSIWGDVRRLDNGNTLITAASMVEGDDPGRLFEVTPDGQVVWELSIGGDPPGDRAAAYGAGRVPSLVSPAG